MTRNRRSKRAIRSRMAQTGEKYTQARRALLAPGGTGGGTGDDPGVTITWPPDSLGWFTDQAYNAILLADDEARMLSHPGVEPEHLLLAAAARGVLGPSTQHLLIALGDHEVPARILAELGVQSAQALVDADRGLPPIGPPVDHALLGRRASQLAARGMEPPRPGPIPPVFERFTAQARAAINAGVEYARRADDRWVEPAHLLFGVLNAKAGVAAAVRTRYGWHRPPAQSAQPPAYSPRATGIFTPEARRIVAEDVLIIAERLSHPALTTGHVLLAILERYAYLTVEYINALPPICDITAAVTDALPGQEDT